MQPSFKKHLITSVGFPLWFAEISCSFWKYVFYVIHFNSNILILTWKYTFADLTQIIISRLITITKYMTSIIIKTNIWMLLCFHNRGCVGQALYLTIIWFMISTISDPGLSRTTHGLTKYKYIYIYTYKCFKDQKNTVCPCRKIIHILLCHSGLIMMQE